MIQAYLAISFRNRKQLEPEIETIRNVLAAFQVTLFDFAANRQYAVTEESLMMQAAFAAIDRSSLLIAEVSEKAIGVGIETGYALAKQKPVIYLRNALTEHSTTVSGSAHHSLIYQDLPDLAKRLPAVLTMMGF